MTMPRAILLLVLSIVVLVGSVLAFIAEHGDGFEFTTRTGAAGTGARTGSNAVEQPGAPLSQGQFEATVQSAAATATALVGTPSLAITRVPGRTPTAVVTPAALGEAVDLGNSRYTVLQLVDPEPPGFFTAPAGQRRVTLEVKQEAIGQAVAYSFALFYLRDTTGEEYVWTITNGEPSFGSGSLNPGESNTGWVTFHLPTSAKPAELVVLSGVTRVVVAELR